MSEPGGREQPARVVLQAHAVRTQTAVALLLHGTDRGPRDLRKPGSALLASVAVAVVLVLAVVIAGQLDVLLSRPR